MKIGIIGCGKIAKEVHIPVIKSIPNVQVDWFCDNSITNALELRDVYIPGAKVYKSLEECNDVDLVLITVPVGLRHALVLESIKRGFHILCEKPFAINFNEHNEYVNCASRASISIGVGMMRRYFRTTKLIQDAIRSGIFGSIREVWASQSSRVIRTGRKDIYQADKSFAGGGVLMETGVHLVDQVFVMLGVDSYRINSINQKLIGDLDFYTSASSTLTLKNGKQTNFNLELSNLEDLYFGITILMDHVIVKVGLFANSDVTLCDLNGNPICNLSGDNGAVDIFQAFYLEWVDFIKQCKSIDHYKSDISADSITLTTRFIDDCYQYNNNSH
jgi:predicted dehydrogenase